MEANESTPIAPVEASSPTFHHSSYHEELEDVICDVADLCYGVYVPVVPAAGNPLSRASRLFRRKIRKSSTQDDIDDAKDTPLVKPLLEGVNCKVYAGEMVAVMGTSGAGKSTFLDLLAKRKTEGVCSGQILHVRDLQPSHHVETGSGVDPERFGDQCGAGRPSVYVTQADNHIAELTVRESLAFAARVGMGDDASEAERRHRVDYLLGVLGLDGCADVRVGNPLVRGISGGQARRLSVGVGVVDLESVRLLMLDEPTTGLDSSSAMEVLQLARRLANKRDRRALVATVHQPSPEMFELFDKVLILETGRQVYYGSASEAAAAMSRPELGLVPEPGQNPAEFILAAAKTVLADSSASPEATSANGEEPAQSTPTSEASHGRVAAVGHGLEEEQRHSRQESEELEVGRWLWFVSEMNKAARGSKAGWGDKKTQSTWIGHMQGDQVVYAVGFWTQLQAVWVRAWTVKFRNTDALIALFAKSFLVGVLTATVFWQQGDIKADEILIDPLLNDVTSKASNMMALLYFAVLYGGTGHMQAIPELFSIQLHFKHERAAGAYSTLVFWLVNITVHIPIITLSFILYVHMCFWSLGLRLNPSAFLYFAMFTYLSNLQGYSAVQALSAACNSPEHAFALWPSIFIVVASFAGFGIRLPVVKPWYRWMCDLSFCRWLYQYAVISEFKGYDEGDAVVNLYFESNHLSMRQTLAVAIAILLGTQLLFLLFLLPRPSRLRIVDKHYITMAFRTYSLAKEASPGDLGHGEGVLAIAASGHGADPTAGGEGVDPVDQSSRKQEDPKLLVVGPLQSLEEGLSEEHAGPSTVRGAGFTGAQHLFSEDETEETESSLQRPLLAGAERALDADVREGCRLSFFDLHYYIYLQDAAGKSSASPSTEGATITTTSTSTLADSMVADESHAYTSGYLPNELHVLRGITGSVSPGEVVAFFGPSGSGKTTLLDLLAGRKTPSVGRKGGEIIVDGVRRPYGMTNSPSTMAYVMQDNTHHGSLTVRQTLEFAAKLRMSHACSARDRNRRVETMVNMLGMQGIMDTKVGDSSKRGISGGQLRRLSIAVEAIDLPGLLVLDEPTSGLDAGTALEVLTAVRCLADLRRTIIMSLHQPSPEMFSLLDKCLLLTRGGYPAYFGKASRAMPYFASIGIEPPVGNENDPAGFLLSVAASAEAPGGEENPSSPSSPIPVGVSISSMAFDSSGNLDASGISDSSVTIDRGIGHAGSAIDAAEDSIDQESSNGVKQDKVDSSGSDANSQGDENPSAPSDAVSSAIQPNSLTSSSTRSYVTAIDPGGAPMSPSTTARPSFTAPGLARLFWSSPGGDSVKQEALGAVAEADVKERSSMMETGNDWEKIDRKHMLWITITLTHRQLLTIWQDKSLILASLCKHVFVGLFYGSLWYQLGVGKIYERVGVIFFSLIFVIIGNQEGIPRVFNDRLMFYRERSAGVYGTFEYWVCMGIAPVPLAMLCTLVYCLVLYPMSGLNEHHWDNLLYFTLVVALCNLIGLALAQALAAVTRVQDAAVAIFPVYLFFFIAFSGFIVRLPTLPTYLKDWAPYASFARWAMEGLVINECKGNADDIFESTSLATPDEVYQTFLDSYGYGSTVGDLGIRPAVVLILLGNLVIARLVTLICLKYTNFERR